MACLSLEVSYHIIGYFLIQIYFELFELSAEDFLTFFSYFLAIFFQGSLDLGYRFGSGSIVQPVGVGHRILCCNDLHLFPTPKLIVQWDELTIDLSASGMHPYLSVDRESKI